MGPELHLPAAVLAERLRALPRPPSEAGIVVLVVARPKVDERVTPARGRLTPEGGLEGDRWANHHTSSGAQLTVMRADVARLFANGQSLTLFGDNLLVELDLSTVNLPVGARLRVGTAVCAVTPKPHTGCGKFAARFGPAARELTLDDAFKGARLRGIHLEVLEAGEVSPGDRIQVVSGPPP